MPGYGSTVWVTQSPKCYIKLPVLTNFFVTKFFVSKSAKHLRHWNPRHNATLEHYFYRNTIYGQHGNYKRPRDFYLMPHRGIHHTEIPLAFTTTGKYKLILSHFNASAFIREKSKHVFVQLKTFKFTNIKKAGKRVLHFPAKSSPFSMTGLFNASF